MPHLSIKIVGKNDKFKFDNIGPTYLLGSLEGAAILEAGMESGKTSIMFHAKVGNQDVILETSTEIIHALNATILGANVRFANKTIKDV